MIKKIFILGLISFVFLIGSAGIALALPAYSNPAPDCADYCDDAYHPDKNPFGFTQPTGAYCICPVTTAKTLEDLLENVINYIFWFATVFTPILIIIAGFYFITSAGNIEKVQKSKRIIMYSCIGYAIVLFARGLVYILADILS